jgi:hypothetical protein
MRATTLVLIAAAAAFAQDSNIHETKFKYDKALRRIAGVLDVSVGGVNGENRIVVRVEDAGARDAVTTLTGGKVDGFAVHVLVSGTSAAAPAPPEPAPAAKASSSCAGCACPCHAGPGRTVAEARKPESKIDLTRLEDMDYTAEKCDVLREILGLPERDATNGVRCTQMTGWTNDALKLKWILAEGLPHWKAKEFVGLRGSDYKGADLKCELHGSHGNGEVVCYTYIRHRQFCPRGMKEMLKDYERMTPGK